jgi:organic radical activating enzyme
MTLFRNDLIQVNEVFGPTVQGEGAAAGRHCLFVRLANCNLECKWCDTPYTWAFTSGKAEKHNSKTIQPPEQNIFNMTHGELYGKIRGIWDVRNEPTIIVWSGGEPMMQQKKIQPMMGQLQVYGNENHIETAGTIAPDEWTVRYVNQFNVSPKLEHSGNPLKKRYKPNVLKTFVASGKAWFKFVVEDVDQLEEVDMMVHECKIPKQRVQIMPEGTKALTTIDRARALVEPVLRRGYGLSLRQHVLLWGDKRGV